MIWQSVFGQLPNGEVVTAYEMCNTAGMEIHVMDYECMITKLLVPDKSSQKKDVVLGFDKFEYYLDRAINPYYGCG